MLEQPKMWCLSMETHRCFGRSRSEFAETHGGRWREITVGPPATATKHGGSTWFDLRLEARFAIVRVANLA